MNRLSQLAPAIFALTTTQPALAENAPTELGSLVITATDQPQKADDVTANVTVITRSEIEQKQYQTLNDALKAQPGFSVKPAGGTGQQSSTYVRGFSQDNLLVLINGVEQTDPSGLSGANLHRLRLADVERIEILKGAQSGVWGANAAAGVINIITSKSDTTQASMEVGSHGHKQLHAGLGRSNERVDFGVDFFTLDTNGFSAVRPYNQEAEDFEDDGHQQTDIGFRLGLNLNEHHRIETRIRTASATTDYDDGSDAEADNWNEYDQLTRSIRYQYQRGPWQGRAQLHHNRIERAFHTGFGTTEYEGTLSEQKLSLTRAYRQVDFVQVSANRKTYDSVSSFSEREDFTQNGVSLTNHNQFDRGWAVTESLRFDAFDRFENALTGKIGVKKSFAPTTYLSMNVGSGYKAPLLSQLSADNPEELKPEQSRSIDITAGLGDWTLTWFKADIRDKIESQGSYPNNVYVNADQETRSRGIELHYGTHFSDWNLRVNASATWQDVTNEQGETPAYVPDQTAQLSLDYQAATALSLGLDSHYTGTQYPAQDRQGKQIGEYVVTDLRAQYQIGQTLKMYARIENLTNADYITAVADYPATGTPPQYVYSQGGRQFFVGLRADL
ncbi:TonB-dependent receptor plug domain-containing protein [Hydrogenovibrio halophilus]|uniref:TonB-dependent receptor plug domain-containing protein n=1 Tax=Hydrogenovibrio halophilus TaxID=373391 RepID=UPI00036A1CC0|nr:TonB-dependent receptor [Hydrogenovibrio halophilus]